MSRFQNFMVPEAKIDAGARALLKLSRGSDKEVGAAVMRGARASAEAVLIAAWKVDLEEEGPLLL